jgi:hypothetical protein
MIPAIERQLTSTAVKSIERFFIRIAFKEFLHLVSYINNQDSLYVINKHYRAAVEHKFKVKLFHQQPNLRKIQEG